MRWSSGRSGKARKPWNAAARRGKARTSRGLTTISRRSRRQCRYAEGLDRPWTGSRGRGSVAKIAGRIASLPGAWIIPLSQKVREPGRAWLRRLAQTDRCRLPENPFAQAPLNRPVDRGVTRRVPAGFPRTASAPRAGKKLRYVGRMCDRGVAARAAAQDILVAHELAVVFAQRTRRRAESRGRACTGSASIPRHRRRAGPGPSAESERVRPGERGWKRARSREVPLRAATRPIGRDLPFRLGRQPAPGPAGVGVGLVDS